MAILRDTIINQGNVQLPSGTSAERPSSPELGQIRYNTDKKLVEFYNGNNWQNNHDWIVTEQQRFFPSYDPRILIHAEAEGNNNQNGYDRQNIFVNGNEILDATTPRSYRFTQLRKDSNGLYQLIDSNTFDAYGDRTGTSTRGTAEEALNFLQTFENYDLLVCTSHDHLRNSDFFAPELVENFQSVNGTEFDFRSERDMYLLIAEKNGRKFYENYELEGNPGFTVSMWLP